MNEKVDREKLEEYYRGFGLENFLSGEEERTFSSLQAARTIVEGFFNGQEARGIGIDIKEKKNALACLLNHPFLKTSSPVNASLQSIVTRMNQEQISDEMAGKIYKLIIYLSVKPYDTKKNRITYSELLGMSSGIRTYNLIKRIDFNNNDISIYELLYNIRENGAIICRTQNTNKSISESRKNEITSYYEGLGLSDYIKVDGKLIYSYENLQQASQIVEEYFSEQEISDKEKKAVLMCILGNPLLRTNNVRKTYDLSTLVNKLKNTELEDKEIFAIIINLGIEDRMLEHFYSEALWDATGFINALRKCQEAKRPTKVDSNMLKKAMSKAQDKEKEVNICEYYHKLDVDYIYGSNGKLCYSESDLSMAREITEGYFEGEEVTDEMKKAVLRSLLNHDPLKLREDLCFNKLTNVVNKMRGKLLANRKIYGFLINLSVSNHIADSVWTYNKVLREPQKLDSVLRCRYNSIVTPETLQKMCTNKVRKGRVCGADVARAGLPASAELCDTVGETIISMLSERDYKGK